MKTKTSLLLIYAFAFVFNYGFSQEWETNTILSADYSEMDDPLSIWPEKETLAQVFIIPWANNGRIGFEFLKQEGRSFIYKELSDYKIKKNDNITIETSLQFEKGDVHQPMGIFFIDSNNSMFFAGETPDGFTYVGNIDDAEVQSTRNNYIKPGGDNYFKIHIYESGILFVLNGKEAKLYNADIKFPVTKVGYFIRGNLAFSSGYYFVTVNNRLPQKLKAHPSVEYLNLLPERNRLVSAFREDYFIWDTETAKKMDSIKTEYRYEDIETNDLKYFLSKDRDWSKKRDFIVIKDFKTHSKLATIEFKGDCGEPFMINDNTVVVHDIKANSVNLYDIPNGTLQKSVKLADKDKEKKLVLLPDLQHAFFKSGAVFKYFNLENGAVIYEIPNKEPYRAPIVAISSDKKLFFYNYGNELNIHQVSDGNLVNSKSFDVSLLGKLHVSPDNKYVISVNKNSIYVIDLESLTLLKNYTMSNDIGSWVVDNNFEFVYVGLQNGELHKMDIASGETVMMFGKIMN
jgi:hypothetical protein